MSFDPNRVKPQANLSERSGLRYKPRTAIKVRGWKEKRDQRLLDDEQRRGKS